MSKNPYATEPFRSFSALTILASLLVAYPARALEGTAWQYAPPRGATRDRATQESSERQCTASGIAVRQGSAQEPAGQVGTAQDSSAQEPARQDGTAQNGSARAPRLTPPLQEGTEQWSFFYAYGINQQINASAPNIDIATGGVRWSHLWGESFDGLLRGHPAVAVEVLPLFAFVGDGHTTWAVGTNLLYEHHFAADGRVLPVWKLGAGVLYANAEVPAGETRFNFSVLTALGVDIVVGERRTLFLGYRFHHVSNANTGDVNPGINAHSLVFGLSLFR